MSNEVRIFQRGLKGEQGPVGPIGNTGPAGVQGSPDTGAEIIAKIIAEENANLLSDAELSKLSGIEDGAQQNVQIDWDETDTESDSFVLNKPDIVSNQDVVDAVSVKADNSRVDTTDEAVALKYDASNPNQYITVTEAANLIADTVPGLYGGEVGIDR